MFGLKGREEDGIRYWETKNGKTIWFQDVIQGILVVLAIFGVAYIMTAFMATMLGLGHKMGF